MSDPKTVVVFTDDDTLTEEEKEELYGDREGTAGPS